MTNLITNRRKLFSILTLASSSIGCLLAQTKIKINQNTNPNTNAVEKSIVLNGSSVVSGVISLPELPATNTITWVMRNGLVQAEGFDYNINGKSITFLFPNLLETTDTFIVRYKI